MSKLETENALKDGPDVQTLHEKLAQIQIEIKAPKSQFNKFGGFYHRNLEDILEAFKKVSRGTYIIINDEILEIGQRVYVKATATISDGINSISACAYAREPLQKKGMDDSQVTGATSSYARKYALGGLLGVDDNKDADTMHNANSPPLKTPIQYKQTPETKALIKKEEYLDKIKNCKDINHLNIIYKNVVSIFGPHKEQAEINDFLMDVVHLYKKRKLELWEN